MRERPKLDALKNARHVADTLARLSLSPHFLDDEREVFRLLARDVLEDRAYVELLAAAGRLKAYPFGQLDVAPRVADRWLEDTMERARRHMQEARGHDLLKTMECPRHPH